MSNPAASAKPKSNKASAVDSLKGDLDARQIAYTPELLFAKELKRRWRLDLAIPEERLAIEIDGAVYVGGRHTRGKGYENDCEKLNTAVLLGWRVLRFSTGQYWSGYALPTILTALGKEAAL